MYKVVNLLNQQQSYELKIIIDTLLVKKKTLDENEDKLIHGTEYDLSSFSQLDEIKRKVENTCSELYNKPLHSKNFWVSISIPNSIVVPHNHTSDDQEVLVSAVLYLQAEQNSGKLLLEPFDVILSPCVGDLICFPGDCVHSVSLNNSSKDRICVAFDLN